MMYCEVIPYDRIERIKPVIALKVGNRYESMAEVKKRVGCTHIINGGTYDMKTRALDSGLKLDGKMLKQGIHGFGSNDERHLEFAWGTWTHDYFGAFKDLIRDGFYNPLYNDKSKRGRTGVGINKDGVKLVVIADSDKAKCTSTDFMKTYFKDCTHAINLDGGGSSQWIEPHSNFASGRSVVWYLCLWVKPDDGIPCKVVNVKTWLAVRNKPSTVYKELGRLYTNNRIKVLEWQGTYAKIAYDGGVAYVTAKYLERV